MLWRGLLVEGEGIFREVLEKLNSLYSVGEELPPEILFLWAKALAWQGRLTLNNDDAIQRYQESIGLIERLDPVDQVIRREKAFLLNGIGSVYISLDREKARQFIEQSLEIYRGVEDSWGIAVGLVALGRLDWGTGNYDLAEKRTQAGLALHQARGDLNGQIEPLAVLGWIHQHLWHLEEAERYRREVLNLCQRLGDRSLLPRGLADLSFTLQWQGRFKEELYWAEQSLAICLEDSRRDVEGYAHLAVGFPLLYTGQYEQARREAEQALAAVQEANQRNMEGSAHDLLGCLALAAHSFDEAEAEFNQGRRLYQEVQDNYLGYALAGQGLSACCRGNFLQARLHFVEALQYAAELKDRTYLVVALPGVALYQALTGRNAAAVETWELAKSQPFVANSRWIAEIVGGPVETGAAALPASVVEEARGRGRDLDLWQAAQKFLSEPDM